MTLLCADASAKLLDSLVVLHFYANRSDEDLILKWKQRKWKHNGLFVCMYVYILTMTAHLLLPYYIIKKYI